MKHLILFISILLSQINWGQTEDAWIFFLDKPQADTFLSQPLLMLSQRSLDRRARLNINPDLKDVPVDSNYINQINSAQGILYKGKSKWLNAVHVQGNQTDIQNLLNFAFVNKIEFANKNIGIVTRPRPFNVQPVPINSRRTGFDYGYGAGQINMLHGEVMHQQNYTGQGVLIGIIDAGFQQVDTASLFQTLFQNHKIVDTYNFVSGDTNVYQFHMHGSAVLSSIAAQSEGVLVGTAPDVSVALYVSEDVSQEMPIEETYWAEAAERADSIGVDVINTSLGYQTYDRPEYSYTMADLNGQTSFISRAAEIAVSRGINVIVSAGNSGNTNWPKIGMPADAADVITVGAVDGSRNKAGFSSVGLTADGRIKPEVMAQGVGAAVYWNGQIQALNGTSFSAPIIAGLVSCMVQANPNKTPAQIKQDLISISDRYNHPDNDYGYGIPDFSQYNLNAVNTYLQKKIRVYPNPAHTFIFVKSTNEIPDIQIYTANGKLILFEKNKSGKINVSHLPSGIYYMKTSKNIQKLIIK